MERNTQHFVILRPYCFLLRDQIAPPRKPCQLISVKNITKTHSDILHIQHLSTGRIPLIVFPPEFEADRLQYGNNSIRLQLKIVYLST